MMFASTTVKLVGSLIVSVQIFDVAIHIATNQFEPIRIASNMVIVVWIGSMILGWVGGQQRQLGFTAVGLYLGLNLVFLSLQGFINQTNGEFRTMLFILVGLTVGLSAFIMARYQRDVQNHAQKNLS